MRYKLTDCYYPGQILELEEDGFEDLSETDTPSETFRKIEKLYNAMREKIRDNGSSGFR